MVNVVCHFPFTDKHKCSFCMSVPSGNAPILVQAFTSDKENMKFLSVLNTCMMTESKQKFQGLENILYLRQIWISILNLLFKYKISIETLILFKFL